MREEVGVRAGKRAEMRPGWGLGEGSGWRVAALEGAEVTHARCGVRVELPPAALVCERLAEVAQRGRVRIVPACEQQLIGLC